MTWEDVFKKEHIVIEADVHAVLDLNKSGAVECWNRKDHDLAAQNKEENCVFGLLKGTSETYDLQFTAATMASINLQ